MDINLIMRRMTVEEKAALVSGTDFMYTNPIPRLGIPSLFLGSKCFIVVKAEEVFHFY